MKLFCQSVCNTAFSIENFINGYCAVITTMARKLMKDIERILEGKRVLNIDDEKMVLMVNSRQLSMRGAEVIKANNAEEGLAKIIDEKPDVVLCDNTMPGKNGVNLLQDLAGEKRDLSRYVLLTSEANPEMYERVKKIGAAGVYDKPIEDFHQLAEICRELHEVGKSATLTDYLVDREIITEAVGYLLRVEAYLTEISVCDDKIAEEKKKEEDETSIKNIEEYDLQKTILGKLASDQLKIFAKRAKNKNEITQIKLFGYSGNEEILKSTFENVQELYSNNELKVQGNKIEGTDEAMTYLTELITNK